MDISDMTVNAYLDEWLGLLRTRIQPTTLRSYADMIDAYLRPVLGSCRIGELSVQQLDLHLVYLLTQGGRRGGPLARKTVHIHPRHPAPGTGRGRTRRTARQQRRRPRPTTTP